MPSTLSAAHKATYDSIFSHPVSHNLEWRSLIAVFNQLGDLEEESNGKMKFSRNGQTLTLHSRGKDVEVEEIMHIRHFLESSEDRPADARIGNDAMVVLDHSGAKIYRAGEETAHLVPLDPSGHDQQVHNPKGDSGGKQGPLRKLFHEALAEKLQGLNRILLVGDGQGASSEVDHFMNELKEHHHEKLAERIVGTEVADISHMTEGDFAARAREFFATAVA